MTGRRVAFLGGGRMCEALVSGLIRSGGRSIDEIMVTCRREERAREIAEFVFGPAEPDTPPSAQALEPAPSTAPFAPGLPAV